MFPYGAVNGMTERQFGEYFGVDPLPQHLEGGDAPGDYVHMFCVGGGCPPEFGADRCVRESFKLILNVNRCNV